MLLAPYHILVLRLVRLSHVMYECGVSRVNEVCHIYTYMYIYTIYMYALGAIPHTSIVSRAPEARHVWLRRVTCEWGMSHMYIYVCIYIYTYMPLAPYHILVLCLVRLSRVMYECGMSRMNKICHVWMRHVTHMDVTCPLWVSHVTYDQSCGVATVGRLLKNLGLFWKRALWKRRYSAIIFI